MGRFHARSVYAPPWVLPSRPRPLVVDRSASLIERPPIQRMSCSSNRPWEAGSLIKSLTRSGCLSASNNGNALCRKTQGSCVRSKSRPHRILDRPIDRQTNAEMGGDRLNPGHGRRKMQAKFRGKIDTTQ